MPDVVHVDQLNAIAYHIGLCDSSQLNHPRAVHNLLGHALDCTSFIARTTPIQWIGGTTPDWPTRYDLFKRYHILNKEVQEEDEKRALAAANLHSTILARDVGSAESVN